MSEEATPFGFALHAALKRQACGPAILGGMKYAELRKLKAATREEVLQLFHGSDYETLQHIRRDAPEEFARFLNDRVAAAGRAVTQALAFGRMFGGA